MSIDPQIRAANEKQASPTVFTLHANFSEQKKAPVDSSTFCGLTRGNPCLRERRSNVRVRLFAV